MTDKKIFLKRKTEGNAVEDYIDYCNKLARSLINNHCSLSNKDKVMIYCYAVFWMCGLNRTRISKSICPLNIWIYIFLKFRDGLLEFENILAYEVTSEWPGSYIHNVESVIKNENLETTLKVC